MTRKKDVVCPRKTQFLFLNNPNFEERYYEEIKLMQNISVLLFGGSFKGLEASFFHMKGTSFDCTGLLQSPLPQSLQLIPQGFFHSY